MKRFALGFVMVVCSFMYGGSADSQVAGGAEPADNPLAPFERLIGGQWHMDGSYQEFEWGVGRRSVRSRSHHLVDGESKLVAEGLWFWHSGEKRIKGVFTAIDMPFSIFEYSTHFEENTMVNELSVYDESGNESVYLETWEFTDATNFDWKLMKNSPEGTELVMQGIYSKK